VWRRCQWGPFDDQRGQLILSKSTFFLSIFLGWAYIAFFCPFNRWHPGPSTQHTSKHNHLDRETPPPAVHLSLDALPSPPAPVATYFWTFPFLILRPIVRTHARESSEQLRSGSLSTIFISCSLAFFLLNANTREQVWHSSAAERSRSEHSQFFSRQNPAKSPGYQFQNWISRLRCFHRETIWPANSQNNFPSSPAPFTDTWQKSKPRPFLLWLELKIAFFLAFGSTSAPTPPPYRRKPWNK